jgi:tetratricopeptide (TPR) repeat protein
MNKSPKQIELDAALDKIKSDPRNAGHYIAAALCLYEMKRYDQAELMALEAATLPADAEDAALYFLIAKIMEAQMIGPKQEPMVRFYRRFIDAEEASADPKKDALAHAHAVIGKHFMFASQLGVARISFTKALGYEPENYEANFGMVSLECAAGDPDAAQAHLDVCHRLAAAGKPTHNLDGIQMRIQHLRQNLASQGGTDPNPGIK